MQERKRYPLSWPAEKARTLVGQRRKSLFTAPALDLKRLFKDLQYEIDRAKGQEAILSTNVPVNVDGTVRASTSVIDPGVCLYMRVDGQELRFACDAWATWRENVRALTVHLESLRAIERYGVGDRREIFAGYAGLATTREEDWRLVLGIARAAAVTRADIEAAFRSLAKDVHPDAGGTAEAMARLNMARDQALAEVR